MINIFYLMEKGMERYIESFRCASIITNINRIVYLLDSLTEEDVMIDRDLAQLYQVETRVLNQAVRRNLSRFPSDFMFQLDQGEFENWLSQSVIAKKAAMGYRIKPLVFTEQGIAMLSSVLNSDLAIQVHIRIIRVFTKIRSLFETHQEIIQRLMVLERSDEDQEKKIMLILDYLKSFEQIQKEEEAFKSRRMIGF